LSVISPTRARSRRVSISDRGVFRPLAGHVPACVFSSIIVLSFQAKTPGRPKSSADGPDQASRRGGDGGRRDDGLLADFKGREGQLATAFFSLASSVKVWPGAARYSNRDKATQRPPTGSWSTTEGGSVFAAKRL